MADLSLLLVEDDAIHAQHIKDALQSLGPSWNVTHCLTGSQALDQLENHRQVFNFAIVDLGLPDIGGLDVIRTWREHFNHEPLLVISVISAERTLLEAIRAGADGYLLKDGDLHAMARGIEQVLRGDSPITPSLARHLFKLAGSPQYHPRSHIQLTAKEKDTLRHISQGRSYSETAALMDVSLSTVQTHVRNLYRKLRAHSQMQAVVKARDQGLI